MLELGMETDATSQAYAYGLLCRDLVAIQHEHGVCGLDAIISNMDDVESKQVLSFLIQYHASK
jgi:hypothetical protein